jgi:hypothetical protein
MTPPMIVPTVPLVKPVRLMSHEQEGRTVTLYAVSDGWVVGNNGRITKYTAYQAASLAFYAAIERGKRA